MRDSKKLIGIAALVAGAGYLIYRAFKAPGAPPSPEEVARAPPPPQQTQPQPTYAPPPSGQPAPAPPELVPAPPCVQCPYSNQCITCNPDETFYADPVTRTCYCRKISQIETAPPPPTATPAPCPPGYFICNKDQMCYPCDISSRTWNPDTCTCEPNIPPLPSKCYCVKGQLYGGPGNWYCCDESGCDVAIIWEVTKPELSIYPDLPCKVVCQCNGKLVTRNQCRIPYDQATLSEINQLTQKCLNDASS